MLMGRQARGKHLLDQVVNVRIAKMTRVAPVSSVLLLVGTFGPGCSGADEGPREGAKAAFSVSPVGSPTTEAA